MRILTDLDQAREWLASRRKSLLQLPERVEQVEAIIEKVRQQGDAALREFTARFDGVELDRLAVTPEEVEAAYGQVPSQFIDTVGTLIDRFAQYYQEQKPQSRLTPDDQGNLIGHLVRPLNSVGTYIPGGRASYPSTVLMNVVPARVAGVPRVVMVSPPSAGGTINPYCLVAASEAGVREIYKIGGAQAVAALAFGTETIAPVDKITGPGNSYVTLAKRLVFGVVGIDMLAGPSEVVILADASAHPAYVAADLLAQAEHDPEASALLFTDSPELAQAVSREIEAQLPLLSRAETAARSLEENGAVILVQNLWQAAELADSYAPEHLEIMADNPWQYLSRINNAGAIFAGAYTPEAVGDYYAGPNHTLPTMGTARFASPLGISDFLKTTSVMSFSRQGLAAAARPIGVIAGVEGFDAHAKSVTIRGQSPSKE